MAAAIICNCFFQLLGCIYPALLRGHKDCPACSPHECPASMSRGSQKSLWTRALVSSIWVDSPADPSKLFYKHATILTERCLVWRGYKKGLKRSHVHLPTGSVLVAVRPRQSNRSIFFSSSVQLVALVVAVACHYHWSRNYQTHTRIIKGHRTPPNARTLSLPCALLVCCFIDSLKLR